MNRRDAALALAGLGVVPIAQAQPAEKLRRVGILFSASASLAAALLEAFKLRMHDLGWFEGRDVDYRVAYAAGRFERLDALTNELVAHEAEVIVAASSATALSAQRATKTIPIVLAGAAGAVEYGLVASLAKPGGNITGVTNHGAESFRKLFDILHQAVPGAARIAIVLNESNPPAREFWRDALGACDALKLVPIRVVANSPDQFEAAARQIVREQAQAIVVLADGMFLSASQKLDESMRVTRLPIAHGNRENVVAGGLLSYGASLQSSFRQAVAYVDKILKGAKPADLPVQQPTQFELVINLKTAKTLGLTIPPSLLLRADEVIQ